MLKKDKALTKHFQQQKAKLTYQYVTGKTTLK